MSDNISLDFLSNMSSLSGSGVKLYATLYYLRELAYQKSRNANGWVIADRDKIMKISGIKSAHSIKSTLVEIASEGWIEDYFKGGFEIIDGRRENVASHYLISDKKLSGEIVKNVLDKIEGKYVTPVILQKVEMADVRSELNVDENNIVDPKEVRKKLKDFFEED